MPTDIVSVRMWTDSKGIQSTLGYPDFNYLAVLGKGRDMEIIQISNVS